MGVSFVGMIKGNREAAGHTVGCFSLASGVNCPGLNERPSQFAVPIENLPSLAESHIVAADPLHAPDDAVLRQPNFTTPTCDRPLLSPAQGLCH